MVSVDNKSAFREDLKALQSDLTIISFMLSQIDKVKDSTDVETLKGKQYLDLSFSIKAFIFIIS